MASSNEITRITRSDLSTLELPDEAFITEVKHLASYNWIEASSPTIAVPGCPALWASATGTRLLRPDSGHVYVDQNKARHPKSPLEPLFRALQLEKPTFDLNPVDLISDRNNLRKLLAFIDPSSSQNASKPFTIVAEGIQNTVIFCRQETRVEETIEPHQFRGFNREFEKAYTTQSIEKSTGHHRIIQYRFGTLNVVVRHETDGYTEFDATERASQSEPVDDMGVRLTESLRIDHLPIADNTMLTILQKGTIVPLESTLQIKTRAQHKPLLMIEAAPQLWLSQTPQMVQAYHTSGMFPIPKVENVRSEVKRWEQQNQNFLKVLAALITKIISLVKEHGRVIIEHKVESGMIVFQKFEGEDLLPRDIYQLWRAGRPIPEEGTAGSPSKPIDTMHSSHAEWADVKIGHVNFTVQLAKVPYFARFVESQRLETFDKAIVRHDAIPLVDVALRGIHHGYRKCFQVMSSDPAHYKILCDTYDFLHVDVLQGATLDDIAKNIRADAPEPGGKGRAGQSLARDSAFVLIYLMIQGKHGDVEQFAKRVYDVVLSVVSQHGTFTSKQKTAVRAVYGAHFSPRS